MRAGTVHCRVRVIRRLLPDNMHRLEMAEVLRDLINKIRTDYLTLQVLDIWGYND